MLKLIDIKKDYISGETKVHALKGLCLEFRKSEFVAILGHSGCGKTTLLNIIGGLDHYTSGDLIINGRSTKKYKDKDWDTYRNHSIGFVFQSYNLIPHQTVLTNVELALTLSGVKPAERRQRAIESLEKVGLGDQIYKKPNQMSGGQMQRVAIARALVNNPDIVLADEPTGALDTETSVQIMEILKEISKDKLIIMVTHNPELAELYANRIIKLNDGIIIDDNEPFKSENVDDIDTSRIKHTSMGFLTALSLSLNNLMTKKARTILTAFAGSIGIIGIALIISLSNGIQNYINKVQGDTLSSYPITIEAESVDMTSMMTSLMGIQANSEENQHDKDAIYSNTILYQLMNSMLSADTQRNNLSAFKEYLDDPGSELRKYASSIQYSYDLDMNLYAKDIDDDIVKTDIVNIMQNAMSSTFGGDYSTYFSTYGSMYSVMEAWQEMLPGENGEAINPILKSQYDLIYGKWPEKYDEVVLIVDKNNEVSDIVLYALGLKSNTALSEDMQSFLNADSLNTEIESWKYEDIVGMSFRYIFPADQYSYDEQTGEYTNIADDELGLKTLYNKGLPVSIVGILRVNEDSMGSGSTGAIGYTHPLIEHIIAEAQNRELVKSQLADIAHDVFSGLPYLDNDETLSNNKKIEAAKDYIEKAKEEQLADVYVEFMSVPDETYIEEKLDEQLGESSRADIEKMITDYAPEYSKMLNDMDDDTLNSYIRQMISEQIKQAYGVQMKAMYGKLSDKELAGDFELLSLEDTDYIWIYNNAMPPVYSDTTLKNNLKKLGYVDINDPSKVNIYASTFEDKDAIAEAIKHYNDDVKEEDEITYTDIAATLMSSITTILNVISYVLIAFVAISLVVSTIMIAIITYVSVLERTKEIGILRAIGASKRDISNVFNAETVIIGLSSGLLGVVVTVLLNIPITAIVRDLTDIPVLKSSLPVVAGVGLVILSVSLTVLAGLIPSGMASKKDPVEALRTE